MPEMHLSIRSQVRKHELHTSKLRMVRAIYNAFLRRAAGLIEPADFDFARSAEATSWDGFFGRLGIVPIFPS